MNDAARSFLSQVQAERLHVLEEPDIRRVGRRHEFELTVLWPGEDASQVASSMQKRREIRWPTLH